MDVSHHRKLQKYPGYLNTSCGNSHGNMGKFAHVPWECGLQQWNHLSFHAFNITSVAAGCSLWYMSLLGFFCIKMQKMDLSAEMQQPVNFPLHFSSLPGPTLVESKIQVGRGVFLFTFSALSKDSHFSKDW